MPLPLTSLTGHFDASDTDFLWKTENGGGSGIHTDHPADGEAVADWDDEGDGISNILFRAAGTTKPLWRSTTPLMRLPCLDFDGSDDAVILYDQSASAGRAASVLLGASAKTVIAPFYPEAISGNVTITQNLTLWGDTFQNLGLVMRDVSGVKTLTAYNNDGSIDSVDVTIATGRSWVAAYRHDGTNLKLRVMDDTGAITNVSTASGATADLSNALHIGHGSVFASTYYNGRIGEIACYNAALSDATLDTAMSYFGAKWLGIAEPFTFTPQISGGGGGRSGGLPSGAA